jgi:CRISPR-associated protein Csb2
MQNYLLISVRFLQPMCHARGDGAEPEWPPSPLRLFESIVAAAAAHWNERQELRTAVPALRWLERLPPPEILAAAGVPSEVKYRLYVPDNVGDKPAASWSRGRDASIADYRTEKDVCPTHLVGDGNAVHYLWKLPASEPDLEKHSAMIRIAARSITHLGWGVDMVAADSRVISEAEVNKLAGERWRPAEDASAMGYRVPTEGTLNALVKKHHEFLNRLGPEGFKPVAPLTTFDVVSYLRATDPLPLPFAAFSLLKTDASGFRPFDTRRHAVTVAAMMRHAASEDKVTRALGWPAEKVARLVLGHGETLGEAHVPVVGPRLAFLPIPSIEPRGPGRGLAVASIRRALVVVLGGQAREDLQQLARLLSGADLIAEGSTDPVAMLSQIPRSDAMIGRYTRKSHIWATVTPVVLPGYDDPRKLRKRLFARLESGGQRLGAQPQKELLGKLDRRIDFLLRKAIRQAGYTEELARDAVIEWRGAGFWMGAGLATAYRYPEKLRRFRRLHVRLTWRDAAGNPIALPGPLCLGGGRFHGLGLFAAC